MPDSTSLPAPESAAYYEEQFMRQRWLWILMIGTAVLMVGLPFMPFDDSAGSPEAIFASLFSLLLMAPVLLALWRVRLRLWVTSDAIHVRYWPFVRHRVIPFDQIRSFRAVTYSPIVDYGGWGVRGFKDDRAYNAMGNRGVKLALTDNGKLLLGSQRADELENAIAAASGRSPAQSDPVTPGQKSQSGAPSATITGRRG